MALSASDAAMFRVAAIRPWTFVPAQPETPASFRNAFQFATALPAVELTVDGPDTSWRGAALTALGASRTQAASNATTCPVRLSDAKCGFAIPSPSNRKFITILPHYDAHYHPLTTDQRRCEYSSTSPK